MIIFIIKKNIKARLYRGKYFWGKETDGRRRAITQNGEKSVLTGHFYRDKINYLIYKKVNEL